MNMETNSSLNKAEIDAKEIQLKINGYRIAYNKNDLQPYEYVRSEWSGSVNSFNGPKNFQITWCKPK